LALLAPWRLVPGSAGELAGGSAADNARAEQLLWGARGPGRLAGLLPRQIVYSLKTVDGVVGHVRVVIRFRRLRTFVPARPDVGASEMGADTIDKQLGALREGDESIAGALSELDAKLTEWLSAMRAGQAAIVTGLAPPGTDAAQPVPGGAGASEAASTGAGAPPAPTSSEADVPTPSESEVVSQPGADTRTRRGSGMFDTPVRFGDGEESGNCNGQSGKDDGTGAGAGQIAAGPSELGLGEDDEALLAELDEETASAVRVKRRLSNNQRSVRELLEEIRAERKVADDQGRPRTQWWRRAHEQQGR
jgi:hypothetical protein